MMSNDFEVLGESRIVQYSTGNAKVEVSKELSEDLSVYITFLAMNIETLAQKLRISTDRIQELIKENIEIEPMDFSSEQGEE